MRFLNNWSNLGEMKSDFFFYGDDKGNLDGVNILLASYGTPSYEGYAFVLFERDGKLYEVNGSHCSCYGLEGQWEPEETSIEALRNRMRDGNLGDYKYEDNPFSKELTEVLDSLPGSLS